MNGDWLVKILFAEYIFIMLVYLISHEWNKALYWFGASVLNISIITGLK